MLCTLRKQKKDDNQSCRLSLQLIIKVPLTGIDAAEREQRASLFALCRAARRKTKSGGFSGRVTRSTLRKQKKDDNQSCRLILRLIIKVPLTGGGFRGWVTRSTLRKQKKDDRETVV